MDFPLSLSSTTARRPARTGRIPSVLALSLAVLGGSLLSTAELQASEAKSRAAQSASAGAKAKAKTQAKQNKAHGKKKAAAAGGAAAAAATAALAIPAADAQQLSSLQAVMLGTSLCEFGQKIHLAESTEYPGYVDLSYKNKRWLTKPVVSPTGALRLEDVGAEALLIQIKNKTMLMNQRTGQRLVDGCIHPKQQAMMNGN